MSTDPKASTAAATRASAAPSCVRSPAWTAVSPLISPAVCSATSASRSLIRTFAPSAAKSSAVARPIRRAEPVTIPPFPSSCPIFKRSPWSRWKFRRETLAGSPSSPAPGRQIPQHPHHVVGTEVDVRVREPDRPHPGGQVGVIPPAVALLLGGGAVPGQAVGLDDEAVLRNPEIHAPPVQHHLGPRRGKACPLDQWQELPLQLGAGQPERPPVEPCPNPGSPRDPKRCRHIAHLLWCHEPATVRLVDHRVQTAAREPRREVDDGQRRRRDRDPVLDDD